MESEQALQIIRIAAAGRSTLIQTLINRFPSLKYPPSCNFLSDINSLVASKQKNVMAE